MVRYKQQSQVLVTFAEDVPSQAFYKQTFTFRRRWSSYEPRLWRRGGGWFSVRYKNYIKNLHFIT